MIAHVRPAPSRSALASKREEFFDGEIEYVPCRQFLKKDAEKLASTPPDAARTPLEVRSAQAPPTGSITPYVAQLYSTRLLTKEEEQYYFRRMNWLKFRAATARGRLDRKRATMRQMREIERWLDEAEAVKSIIITANLRLVVSIAKKFVDANNTFDELVSEGNVALIRSVEKFNFALGNRFSTYATYAIQRIFYRQTKKVWQQRQRFVSDDASLAGMASSGSGRDRFTPAQVESLKGTFAVFLESLEPREREIVIARFGFDGREPRTFRELGSEMGVCKERIRQIQGRAMEKLRAMADEVKLEQTVDNWL
jgi:RNA polymerase primary sigma factor